MKELKFNYAEDVCDHEPEAGHIKIRIAKRIVKILREDYNHTADPMSIQMDLDVMGYIFAMDWNKLLASDDQNLCHDYFGFVQRLDRSGTWHDDCFVPRCTASREVV